MTEEVRRAIAASFEHEDRPDDDDIVYDDSGAHVEGTEIKEEFRSHTWQDVPLETVVRRDTALSFFTPEGFRYYLPAYLLAVLEHFDETDVLPDNVVYYLTLPTEIDVRIRNFFLGNVDDENIEAGLIEELEYSDDQVHRFVERVSGFDAEQGRAIRKFLVHLREAHADHFGLVDPETAIHRYWFIYE